MSSSRSQLDEGRILSVHLGQSASCSSVGSVVDFLFVSSILGAAMLSAIVILLRRHRALTEHTGPEVRVQPQSRRPDGKARD
jgi:hypothetical protein